MTGFQERSILNVLNYCKMYETLKNNEMDYLDEKVASDPGNSFMGLTFGFVLYLGVNMSSIYFELCMSIYHSSLLVWGQLTVCQCVPDIYLLLLIR